MSRLQQKDHGLQIAVETISPREAAEYLQASVKHKNRKITKARVVLLSRDMSSNEWQLNGETVKFNGDGHLIDGQHRMMAAIRADKAFTTITVRGIESNRNIDTNKTRSLANILHMDGEKYANELASAISFMWRYREGIMQIAGEARYPSRAEGLKLLDKDPRLRESVYYMAKRSREIEVPTRLLIGLYHIFSGINEEAAQWFFERLGDGAELEQNEPVYLLRERLRKNTLAKANLSARDITALIIKAWNANIEGRAVTVLKWASAGPSKEVFPEISKG